MEKFELGERVQCTENNCMGVIVEVNATACCVEFDCGGACWVENYYLKKLYPER